MSRRSSKIRTPTEKGREYQLGLLYEERERSEARIRKTVKEMEVILSSSFSTELLTSKQAEIDNEFGKYLEVHSKRQVLLEDTIKRNLEEKSADELDREVFQLKKKILNAMSDRKSTSAVSRRTGSSAKGSSVSRSSKRSSHSSRKSMQSKVMEEETKLEELKIEAEFLQRQKEADLTAKQVQLQIEMEKSAAKLKIYKDYEEQIENLPDPPNCNDASNDGYVREYVNLHRKSEPKVEVQNTKQIRRTVEEKSSVDQLASMLKHLQAPNIEIDYFSGDPLSFTYFLATFEEVVESKIDEQRGCLTRLLKYLRGEPKDLVSSCIYMASEVCYSEAKRILVERYGDPNRILGEYRKQLKAWPKVKPNDTAALRKFQTFAIKYRSASRFNTDMQCTDVVQLLHSKLPSYLQNSWNRKASKIRKKRAKEAQVDDFLHWLSDEVDVATDPLYSRDVSYESAQADLSRTKPHQRPSRSTVYQSSTSLTLKCPLCEELHDLDDCLRFLRKPLEERRDFLFKTRLCFSCYNPSSKEHSARNCPNRRTCKECGGKHATGLHGYLRPRQSQDSRRKPFPKEEGPPKATLNDNIEVISSNTAHLSNPVISLCIVPVKIYGSNPAKCVETHALLDTGSQGTFIKEELLDQLEQDRTPTTIKLKTLHGETLESCSLVSGLSVSGVSDTSSSVKLPITYSRKELPVDRDEVPTQHKIERFSYLRSIQDMLPSDDQQITLGILIGSNCPNALEPIKIIPSEEGGPYAFKTALGWCVSGPMSSSSSKVNCNRIFVRNITNGEVSNHHFRIQDEVKESSLSSMLMDLYNNDFSESPSCINSECDVSQEDLRFLKLMEDDVKVIDGHYQLPLPLRDKTFNFPNNKSQAHQRAEWLKRKLQTNKRMHGDYCKFMSNIFEKGYAVKAPMNAPKGQTWYLPNFGVYHPRKPDKLRVVLDCSASYQGMSLNKQLLQGPDLTNQLIGVLSRFRMEQVAIIADIESIFYQVKVPESQHNLLRFLWWPNGNLQKSLEEYVMKVHIFGAIYSPSCANFAIKKTAKDFESVYGKESANTLRRNFYVDDMLKAYPSNEVAINSFPKVVKMCKSGGFRLTKVVSNSRKVMQTINKEEVGKEFKELDLSKDLLPVERALGVHWSIENDCFGFRITLKDKPVTRRGILSTVSSIYDPLGFASPFLLQGKLILQQLCADQKGWDDELSSEQRMSWEKWRTNLPKLESIKVNRCIKPSGFGIVTKVSLHHFSDASEIAYGQVSYIRVENTDGMISTTFLMGKSRVAPMKQTTIPRLELTAALVSARIGSQLKRELDLDKVEEHYWTDSEVVLGYLKNEGKRFHTFVANRVSNILSLTPRDQWCYVQSKDNPADDASRGLDINKYNDNQRWFTGPRFISQPIDTSTCTKEFNVSSDDKEVKVKISTNEVTVKEDFLSRFDKVSSWFKLRRVVARIIQWRTKGTLDVASLQDAENRIIKIMHKGCFKAELSLLEDSNRPSLPKKSPLQKLNPFLHNGIIRVGGRLENSALEFEMKHPIVLPKTHPISSMIIRWCHQQCQHGGRGLTLYALRQNGYWVVSANTAVRSVIFRCVTCRKLRGKTSEQIMANLPADRVNDAPVFTNCGVDMFGPFYVKDGRKEVKRYGAMFTCLCSRAVHIETTTSLETDTFIQALRRLIARRGNVRQIRCDNGTNFVGASNELQAALQEMDHQRISDYLQLVGTDWIVWKRNPPLASHFGGVWERQIRTARSILSSLLQTHSTCLTDEGLRTLLVEVEGIINSRPLTVESLSDVNSLIPLAPVNLLTRKSKVILPPPGDFQRADLFCRRRWRRIQHLTNEFWVRWRKEYLNTLQQRTKWQLKSRNFKEGDVVILRETSQRNDWKLARVTSCQFGQDGNVRSVFLKTASGQEVERPISKVVLLVEAEYDSPPRE